MINTIFSKKSWGVLITSLIVIYFSANMISDKLLSSFHFDLTEKKIHTISKGTKSILKKVDEDILIKVYFSNQLAELSPQYKNFYVRLKTLLKSYNKLSNSHIKTTFYNPESYSEVEDDAMLSGLKSATVREMQSKVYFGLVATNSIDKKEIIPFFELNRAKFLEYDLSLIIHKLSQNNPIRVGVISSMESFGSTLMMKQLRGLFDINIIANNSAIDDNIKTLLVFKPESLSNKDIFNIEQYVLGGGNILLFVDPISENEENKKLKDDNSPLVQNLLKSWGVEYSPYSVALDIQSAISVQANTPQGVVSLRHPSWLALTNKSLSKDNIITANLNKIAIANSGYIKPIDNNNTFIPLISTSNIGFNEDIGALKYLSYDAIKRLSRKGDETLVLSAHISKDNVDTIFAQGITDEETNTTLMPKRKKSIEPINAIIVADGDILMDNMWARESNFFGQMVTQAVADNAKFVTNAIENLNGNDAFINLRGRGESSKPFVLLEGMKLEAEQRFLKKEADLRAKLDILQKKINRQREEIKDSTMLNQTQQNIVNQAQSEMVNVRKSLRAVQHDLKKDIDFVENIFKWANILGIPIFILLLGWVLNRYFRHKRQEYFN